MVEANCLGLQEFRTTGNHAKLVLKNVRADCTVEIMMIAEVQHSTALMLQGTTKIQKPLWGKGPCY